MQAQLHSARRRVSELQAERMRRVRERVMEWLSQGLSPAQLAITLALGLAIGCVPLLGVTTVICAGLAFTLRLNMPAIQAANWAAMPLQVLLLLPFLRLGQKLFAAPEVSMTRDQLLAHLQSAPWNALTQMSSLLGHALLAWLITAGPAFLLLAAGLTVLFRQMPRLAAAEER
jgi:uncharacterized protein (DUF2062 family)